MPTDPRGPETLAARLTLAVLQRAIDAVTAHQPNPPILTPTGAEKMRAVLVAALTPEPVTLTITSRGRELCADCGGNGVFNTRTGVRTCERCHGDCYEPTPEPVTPPVAATCEHGLSFDDHPFCRPLTPPADDGRGLAVDMLDVDRLREVSAHLAPHRRTWLRELADRLATQLTETLSLRESLRKAEQERDALQKQYDALITRCMELPGR